MSYKCKKITVIANGFQEDYVIHYLNSLSGKIEQIDFLGSSIYPRDKIDVCVRIFDVRGGGISDLQFLQKILRVFTYYTLLARYFIRNPGKYPVHIHWLRFKILDGIVLPLLLRMTGKRVIYTVHDILPHDKDTILNKLIFWIIYRANRKLIVHTRYLKDRLCNEFKINSSRIAVLKHGVYSVSDHLIIKNREDAKQKLGFNADVKLVLFFGFITHYKGLDILLRAIANIRDNGRIALLVAGRVNDGYKKTLDELIQSYQIQIDARFIIRKIEDNELPLLFGAADITALPYREASQSGVLFMSYAYGVPVIVPDIGGFPYDVANGKSGFIFQCTNEASLTKTLEDFRNNNNNHLWSGEEIRKFARDNYSWDLSAKELIEFINK